MGHDLIALAGGGGNGDDVGVGGSGARRKAAKVDTKVVDLESEVVEGVIDVLEAGFDDVTVGVKLARSVLTNSVSQLVGFGGLFAGGDVEIAPGDFVGRGGKGLGQDLF